MLDRYTATQNLRALILLACWLPAAHGAPATTAGRSVFDKLFAKSLPVPFSALVEQIQRDTTSHKSVLIPFSRSLQRKAGAPDFYKYPRLVIAVDGEWKPANLDVRDKLFLGYNEKSDALEAISYNESGGRFEFQVVHNYSRPDKRRIVYANRNSCVACHQNEAPIFAVAPWDETEANNRVAGKLSAIHGKSYLGANLHRSLDIVYELDGITDRANLIPVAQTTWRELCHTLWCRRGVLQAMLRMRLERTSSIDLAGLEAGLKQRWRSIFPRGLKVPDPNIPNRDPFGEDFNPMEVRADLEPLLARRPLETLEFSIEAVGNIFEALAFTFTEADLRLLKPVNKIEEAIAKVSDRALAPPFRREIIMKAILDRLKVSYEPFDERLLPPIEVDTVSPVFASIESAKHLKTFKRCALCHDNQIGVPPNFLSGTADEIKSKLNHCSERIYYRLQMWHQPEDKRGVTPMPPVATLELPEEEWEGSAELRAMESYMRGELKDQTAGLTRRAFSSLRECLRKPAADSK